MDTILDILFLALSVFIIFITVGFAILAVYIILVLKSIYELFQTIKQESEKMVADIEILRAGAKSGGVKFASLVLSALAFLKHSKKSKKE